MTALVGLLVEPGEGAALRPLVRALASRVETRALGRCPRPPDGVLASGALAARRAPAGIALATCVSGGVLVGGRKVQVPDDGVDLSPIRPYAPGVRARWRQRLGLPPDVVVHADALPVADRPEALRTATVAVVGRDDLPVALALGTPCVATVEAAASIGAVDGRHLVVADDTEAALAAAQELAADPVRSARLATHGRRLVVERLDVAGAARAVIEALLGPGAGGPFAGSADPRARLDARLAELHTPAHSRIRGRTADATRIFTPAAEARST